MSISYMSLKWKLLRNALRQQGTKTKQNTIKYFIRRKLEEEQIIWNKGLYLYFLRYTTFGEKSHSASITHRLIHDIYIYIYIAMLAKRRQRTWWLPTLGIADGSPGPTLATRDSKNQATTLKDIKNNRNLIFLYIIKLRIKTRLEEL